MRKLRKIFDVGFPLAGILVVLAAVLFIMDLRLRVAVAVVGILIIEVGIWRVAHQFIPSERRYSPLRREVDEFIERVRQLNSAALDRMETGSPEAERTFEGTLAAMHGSVDRMALLAGRTRQEVETVKKPGQADPRPGHSNRQPGQTEPRPTETERQPAR